MHDVMYGCGDMRTAGDVLWLQEGGECVTQFAEVLFFIVHKKEDGTKRTFARVRWLRATTFKHDLLGWDVYRLLPVERHEPGEPSIIPVASILRIEHFVHACHRKPPVGGDGGMLLYDTEGGCAGGRHDHSELVIRDPASRLKLPDT